MSYTKKTRKKDEILRKSAKVRQVKTKLYNPKIVFIVPDQNILEREPDTPLWAQIKETGAKNPNSRFKTRVGQIVSILPNQT